MKSRGRLAILDPVGMKAVWITMISVWRED